MSGREDQAVSVPRENQTVALECGHPRSLSQLDRPRQTAWCYVCERRVPVMSRADERKEAVTLPEFLTARFDDDEAAAFAAAAAIEGGIWHPDAPTADGDYAAFRAHIARHDPARTLREVVGKRKILAECLDAIKDQGNWGEDGQQGLAEEILPALAAIYSDHPDYDQEWARFWIADQERS